MVRFEALAFLPWTFPNEMKFKCWCTYAPSSPGLTTASTHLLARLMAGSVPDHRADGVPAKCPESLLPHGCDPHGGDAPSASSEGITPPSSLLRTHSPVAAASPLLRFMASLGESGQVVHQSLLPAGPC